LTTYLNNKHLNRSFGGKFTLANYGQGNWFFHLLFISLN
jgi:hypothetical protein